MAHLPVPNRPEFLTFPEGFMWGTATASYQIEGSALRHGGGASVWDTFCNRPGAVINGDTGMVGCNHYEHWREDVALMKKMGLKAYRFSMSWPRLFPEGVGRRNEEGFAFYNGLIDTLIEAGITPLVTLFHWDYPQALYERGGWLSPDSPAWFADYATACVEAFGDRVKHWITMNETVIFLKFGHWDGGMAPGIKLSRKEFGRALRHTFLAHGHAVRAIRAASAGPCQVSYAPVAENFIPRTESPEDIAAASSMQFAALSDLFWSRGLYYDPVLKGEWPADVAKAMGDDQPEISAEDLEIMSPKLDFLGLNYYSGTYARAGENGPESVPHAVAKPDTAVDWPVTPSGLYWTVRQCWERYQLPLFITENGLAYPDWVQLDGHVHDTARIDFLQRYLQWLHRATAEGIPVVGYTQWSMFDNFEWASGFRERFGLIHVDYETQKRTPKDSAKWYSGVIASNGASLWEEPRIESPF
jgi:beta-glucosidase